MSGTETAEVRVRLVASQEGDEVISRMQKSMKDLSAATASVNSILQTQHAQQQENAKSTAGLSSWAMAKATAAGHLMAEGVMAAYEKVTDKAKEFYNLIATEAPAAAAEEEESINSLAGIFTMIDGAGHSYEALIEQAGIYHDELEQMGIEAGVSADKMRNAFDTIAERSEKSTQEIQDLVGQMAVASRVVPGGIDALGQGFSMIEMGAIRAKNPVVQLIAQTGILEGNAKEVAKQMMKMDPKKAIDLGEQAIKKMADKAKDIPLTLGQIKQSMKDIGGNIIESLGGGILKEITAFYGQRREGLMKAAEKIGDIAKGIGDHIGTWIRYTAPLVDAFKEAFAGGGDLATSLDMVFQKGDEVFRWIYDNKDAIAKTFKDVFDVVIDAIKKAWELAKKVLNALDERQNDEDVTDPAKRKKFFDEQMEEAKKIAMDPNASRKDIDEQKKLLRRFGGSDVADYEKGIERYHKDAVSKVSGFDKAAQMAGNNDSVNASAMFFKMYNQAKLAHDDAAIKYAMGILKSSKELQIAIGGSSDMIEGGLNDFTWTLKKFGLGQLAGLMPQLRKEDLKQAGTGITMNGGQTFNIKQDFRDQDPDRVAIVFREDLMRAAFARGTAKTSGPFAL